MAVNSEGPDSTLEAADGYDFKVVCREAQVSESLDALPGPYATVSNSNARDQRSPTDFVQYRLVHVLHCLSQMHLRQRGSGSDHLYVEDRRLGVPFNNQVGDAFALRCFEVWLLLDFKAKFSQTFGYLSRYGIMSSDPLMVRAMTFLKNMSQGFQLCASGSACLGYILTSLCSGQARQSINSYANQLDKFPSFQKSCAFGQPLA